MRGNNSSQVWKDVTPFGAAHYVSATSTLDEPSVDERFGLSPTVAM